jgi:hypothetical protein
MELTPDTLKVGMRFQDNDNRLATPRILTIIHIQPCGIRAQTQGKVMVQSSTTGRRCLVSKERLVRSTSRDYTYLGMKP